LRRQVAPTSKSSGLRIPLVETLPRMQLAPKHRDQQNDEPLETAERTSRLPTLPVKMRSVQAQSGCKKRQKKQLDMSMRPHLIHRPGKDIIPPGGAPVSPLISFDTGRLSCCRHGSFARPAELGAVDPDGA